MKIPLAVADYRRSIAKEADVLLRNRYFESNPVLTEDQVGLLQRPSLKWYKQIDQGPIRAVYSQTGSFDSALFIVDYTSLYRLDTDSTLTFIGGGIYGTNLNDYVSMAATANIGSTPEYLFIADGRLLWVYDGATISQVATPDDVGIVSVGYIGSHVIVVPAQGQGINGRYYWIEPGEITIDPLNFATAERSPDPIYNVVVFGDQFWLPGQSTTEVWFMSGNPLAPVTRLQGVTFDRGTWQGTAIQVKDSMIIVDSDGGVFQVSGGANRISNPSIEQRIRVGMQRQAASA